MVCGISVGSVQVNCCTIVEGCARASVHVDFFNTDVALMLLPTDSSLLAFRALFGKLYYNYMWVWSWVIGNTGGVAYRVRGGVRETGRGIAF